MMKKYLFLLTVLLTAYLSCDAQKIQSPSEFLGYTLGEQFTPHYRVLQYYRYLAGASGNVRIQEYGKSNEGRPLLLAFVGSEENISRISEIRENNLRLAGMSGGSANEDQPAIIWLSYNVHGNEGVSTEASMQTIYALLDPSNTEVREWLKNTLVVFDPCLNPDGRERYVNFYNPVRNLVPDVMPFSREHVEPWPGGRSNHYYFDLNRDWAWQSQMETQQRMAVYNQWLPQVHVDFHEQAIDQPYYFAPAAEPYHQDITPWQREFQVTIGKNNARYFDKNGWMYFTRERFDLLYPSYGDTYPIYNGSIGMTYEQGGAGRAGLAVMNAEGDTLTLKDRIDHHHTTGLATIETASQYASRLVTEFKSYFASSRSNPPGEYKSYVIKGENTEKLNALADLLKRNGIEFGYGVRKTAQGYNYLNGKTESFKVAEEDLVVSAFQPKSVLLKVLLEPQTFIADSATYDITAWSLPYAYGLPAFATNAVLKPGSALPPAGEVATVAGTNPVAYAANWNSVADVKFLSALLKRNIKVRYSEVPFETGGMHFNPGSLIITRMGNEDIAADFGSLVTSIASLAGVRLQPINSAFMEKGADLGSDRIKLIRKPRILTVSGPSVSSSALGEIWHFFEQQIGYPITIVRSEDLSSINLSEADVIIFPDGNYAESGSEKIQQWVRAGGKLIALQGAAAGLAGKKGFDLKNKTETKKSGKETDPYEQIKIYEDRKRESVRTNIPGAIYKVNLDNTHPLAFGYPDYYYTLKLDDRVYEFLQSGWNVGVLKKNNYVSGFVGAEARARLIDGLLFGVQEMGKGSVVYLADDLLFRNFWENGKLMFSNSVFMVGQ